MQTDPATSPLSVPARPEMTGGRRVGVLLVHGFTGSPYSMKPWARALADRGYAVEVPLLPGHGTHWRDLNRTSWQEWCDHASLCLGRLAAESDAVVVGGLSMGGAVALRLAADNPHRVAGVVLVNPAVHSRRRDVRLLPVLKHVVPAFPGIRNDIKKPGMDEHAYPRTPLKAAHSMFRGYAALRADLPKVTAPLLVLRSTVDHVVDDLSEQVIAGAVSSRDVTWTPLTNSFHVATLDHDADTIHHASADFVARVTAMPADRPADTP